MPRWLVISPEYPFTERLYEYGGPTYNVSAVAEIEADSGKEAIVKALHTDEFKEWVNLQRGDNRNPLSGVKAELLCPVCDNAQVDGHPYSCLICGCTALTLHDLLRIARNSEYTDYETEDICLDLQRFSKPKRSKRILRYYKGKL